MSVLQADPEVIGQLKAAIDKIEAHAKKTIHLAEKANNPASWQGHYGINLPYSFIRWGGQERLLAKVMTENHDADTQFLIRSVKRAIEGANRDLNTVASIRLLLEAHNQALHFYSNNPVSSAGELAGLWQAITFIAQGYGIEIPE